MARQAHELPEPTGVFQASPAERQRATQFKPGQSGNPAGRRRGSRNRLAEDFISDLREAWERDGPTALKICAATDPVAFVKVIASILPRDVEITADISITKSLSVVEAFRVLAAAPPAELEHAAIEAGE
jgi:hypothetical protein